MSVNSTFAGETKIHLATFETYEAKKCKGFFRVRTCSEKLNILDRHQCVSFRLFYNLIKRLLYMGNLSRWVKTKSTISIQNSLICFYEKKIMTEPLTLSWPLGRRKQWITRCKKSSNQISKWNTDIQNVPLNLIPKTR